MFVRGLARMVWSRDSPTHDLLTTSESNGHIKTKLQWNVRDFRELASKNVGYYTTKSFVVHASEKYQFTLCLYPHGFSDMSKDYVSLWLKKDSQKEMAITFTCSIFAGEEEEDICRKTIGGKLALESVLGWSTFCHRHVILDEDSRVLNEQCLTLNVEVNILDPNSIPNPEIEDDDPGCAKLFEELSDDFRQLFADGCFSDLVLKVKEQAFDVHKVVLCARSPVLKTMMQSSLSKSQCEMEMTDVSSEAMAKVLKYLYSGQLENLSVPTAREMFYVADKYEMISLRRLCSRILAKNLEIANVIDALLLADRHGDSELRVKCLSFMDKNLREIKKLPYWIQLMQQHPKLADKAIFYQELRESAQ